jgi:uncharacterized membrane protein YoaK (UPF0700 family)
MLFNAQARPFRIRDGAAVFLAATSGATDAIGYLALGHVFTSAMTGNLVLLGISLAHRNGERAGRVLASLFCFVVGCAIGARIARSHQPGDEVWPRAVTRALAVEAGVFALYAATWWVAGPQPAVAVKAALLGIGAIGLGIQSITMQRFGVAGLNTTFLSGTVTTLVSRLATGHRFRDVQHHVLLLGGLVVGGSLAAVLVLHAPGWVPLVQLVPLGVALAAAGWQHRIQRRSRQSTQSPQSVPVAQS